MRESGAVYSDRIQKRAIVYLEDRYTVPFGPLRVIVLTEWGRQSHKRRGLHPLPPTRQPCRHDPVTDTVEDAPCAHGSRSNGSTVPLHKPTRGGGACVASADSRETGASMTLHHHESNVVAGEGEGKTWQSAFKEVGQERRQMHMLGRGRTRMGRHFGKQSPMTCLRRS